MPEVMAVLSVKVTHHNPDVAFTDDDLSACIAQALERAFPKHIGFGPPTSALVTAGGTQPRPSVVVTMLGAKVMVYHPVEPERNGVVESPTADIP